eukprot:CAMPEP_0170120518 /NCGR_PEP_ID=MMETSP0020_2-20130122/15201_1 /TAXON_ID=98059 /ORGANISM="Dinobryon sp., Strain UTEXLB2267" /LENGTH=133 /DNA_ID=CAMNT_0010350419 /DNA_START=24 /DNA_END=422 /DNA_ORIENTATION=+
MLDEVAENNSIIPPCGESVANKLQTLSKYEMRDLIANLEHKLFHLEKSQVYLREILEECPNDSEFEAALNENNIIIKNKREEITDLKLLLQSIDPAYYIENRNVPSNIYLSNQVNVLDTSHDVTVAAASSSSE